MDSSSVVSITPDQKVIEAFKLMVERKISSVAVIDNGRLVGNICAKDIRAISSNANEISRLYQNYSQFIVPLEDSVEQYKPSGYFGAPPTMKLGDLVEQIIDKGLHHSYVLEDDNIRGVLSIGDLIRLV